MVKKPPKTKSRSARFSGKPTGMSSTGKKNGVNGVSLPFAANPRIHLQDPMIWWLQKIKELRAGWWQLPREGGQIGFYMHVQCGSRGSSSPSSNRWIPGPYWPQGLWVWLDGSQRTPANHFWDKYKSCGTLRFKFFKGGQPADGEEGEERGQSADPQQVGNQIPYYHQLSPLFIKIGPKLRDPKIVTII